METNSSGEEGYSHYTAFSKEIPKWECSLFGLPLIYHPDNKKVPNWFQRKMQFIFFGNVWRRLVE